MSDDVSEAVAADIPPGYAVVPWHRGFGRQVGPLYVRDAGGRRTFGFRVAEHHTNGLLNAHGGMLMTVADVAWGNLISYERSMFWVTVRLTCDFLSAAKLGEWVEAGSDLLHRTGDLHVIRGRVWTGERTLVTGRGVFKAVGPREPRPGEKAYASPPGAGPLAA